MHRVSLIFCLLLVWRVHGQQLENIGQQAPIQLRGAGTIQFDWYQVDGIDPRQQPVNLLLAGTPRLSLYGVELPFRLFLSNHQRSVQQPFSQFGISPEYRWAKLHLGYNEMFFSPYTLANHRFLGAGLELNPGKWRIAAAYGRFQKAIAQEFVAAVPEEDAFLLEDPVPSFQRKAAAFKLGFGNEKSFIDLLFLQGRDTPESLDSVSDIRLRPRENTVAGLSFALAISKRIQWTGNTAASAQTRDLISDTLSLEDFPTQGFLEQLINPRESSNLTFAGDSKLNFIWPRLRISLAYKRIDPGYQSMGAYFFQTDLEQFNLQTNFTLAKGKFAFAGLLGRQRDNLYQLRTSTGRRLIGNVNVNWNPNQRFGIGLNYSNFGITQDPAATATLADTLLLRQVSHNLNIVPRYSWFNQLSRHNISLVIGWFALQDIRDDIQMPNEASTRILHLNYLLGLSQSGWQFRGSLLFRSTETIAGVQQQSGFSLGVNRVWPKSKFRLGIDAQYFRNRLEESPNGHTLRWGLRSNFPLNKQLSWTTQLVGLQNRQTNKDFSELRASTGLSFHF